MATYEIVPLTTSSDQPSTTIQNIDLRKCRELCTSDDECAGYLYNYPPDKKGETSCSFFKKISKTKPSQTSSLYIKKENHSYWILWLFLACLFFIIFFSRCGKKRF